MARTRPTDRFQHLLDAALRVFAAKGVARTRMADIAREMGVATGSLYNYVESKDALFQWIVERGADDGVIEAPAKLPIRMPSARTAKRRLREQLALAFDLPVFAAAERRRRPGDAGAELEAVAREIYDRIAAARRPMTVIERSARDLPELHALYFVELRRAFFARFARWIARRQRAGHFRRDLDARVTARFVLESITYFARHRFGDLDPDAGLPDDDRVRTHVVRLVVATLVPDPTRRKRRRA